MTSASAHWTSSVSNRSSMRAVSTPFDRRLRVYAFGLILSASRIPKYLTHVPPDRPPLAQRPLGRSPDRAEIRHGSPLAKHPCRGVPLPALQRRLPAAPGSLPSKRPVSLAVRHLPPGGGPRTSLLFIKVKRTGADSDEIRDAKDGLLRVCSAYLDKRGEAGVWV